MKGGYVLVDLKNVKIDKATGTPNKIDGVFKRLQDANASGKNIVLCNIGELVAPPYKIDITKTSSPTICVENQKITFMFSFVSGTSLKILQIMITSNNVISYNG